MECGLEFESNTAKSFSGQQLAGIAQEAKRQMDKDYVNRSPSQYTGIRKPTAVTVLAIGNRIYIASTIKASNYIMDSGHKNVKVALLRTQEELCRIKTPPNECQLWRASSIALVLYPRPGE